MFQFLPRIFLDFASFWIGILAATLLWFLYTRLKPHAGDIQQWVNTQAQTVRSKLVSRTEDHLRQKTLEFAQRQHLSAHLFPLDEILIEPNLFAPPHQLTSEGLLPDSNSIQQTIPYTPDAPEFASDYQYPTINIEDALTQGANLALIGKPGSGKTVALADFASRLARREVKTLTDMFPVFIDAVDLVPYLPADDLLEAVTRSFYANPHYRQVGPLEHTTQELFEENRAFLLLDSVDRLTRRETMEVMNFIKSLQHTFPELRLITTSSAEYYDGLLETDLCPVALASWGTKERARFAKNWGRKYAPQSAVSGDMADLPSRSPDEIDPLLLNSWLFFEHTNPTPLTFTLKVWALFAGDVLGPTSSHAIEAYLRRLTSRLPDPSLPNLQKIGFSSVTNHATSFTREDINRWLQQPEEISGAGPVFSENPLGDMISTCMDLGILTLGGDRRYRFTHATIGGYLAGKACSSLPFEKAAQMFLDTPWSFAAETFKYAAPHLSLDPLLTNFSEYVNPHDPLRRKLLRLASTLPALASLPKVRDHLLKEITRAITRTPFLETKLRLAVALAGSGDQNAPSIFRYFLSSPEKDIRHIAALASGYLRDTKAVEDLLPLLHGDPILGQAACLALVNINTPEALETVAELMLHGEDRLRRAAAEALANDVTDGHPTLKDASEREKLTVRHAAVFGLKRIHEPWSVQILDEMRMEEDEWVVRDAAQQAYEALRQPSPLIPSTLLSMKNVPHLAEYARSKDVNLDSNPKAFEMLQQILKDGTTDQIIAALYYSQMVGFGSLFPEIYHILLGKNDEAKRAAASTMWHLSLTGMDIPSPKKYGLL